MARTQFAILKKHMPLLRFEPGTPTMIQKVHALQTTRLLPLYISHFFRGHLMIVQGASSLIWSVLSYFAFFPYPSITSYKITADLCSYFLVTSIPCTFYLQQCGTETGVQLPRKSLIKCRPFDNNICLFYIFQQHSLILQGWKTCVVLFLQGSLLSCTYSLFVKTKKQ